MQDKNTNHQYIYTAKQNSRWNVLKPNNGWNNEQEIFFIEKIIIMKKIVREIVKTISSVTRETGKNVHEIVKNEFWNL